jgi:hypothetical protein
MLAYNPRASSTLAAVRPDGGISLKRVRIFRKWRTAFSLTCIMLLLAGCGALKKGREVTIGERFKLTPEEKVSVKDTALTIQLKSVRRSWRVDGKSETADADLVIALDGKEQRQWVDTGEKVAVGDYLVELWGADPFGKTSCQIIVTRR